MKIIKPSVEFVTPINQDAVLKRLEEVGRTCYKSESKIVEGSAEKFVRMIIKRGHNSVLEHCHLSVRIICDRGVSHELVRHRIAAYSQESTRYCNYSHDNFNGEITFIEPPFFVKDTPLYVWWQDACAYAETAYFNLLEIGATPEEARTVLPNSLKTEIVATMDIAEWRHVLRERCSRAAHPQMREVMWMVLNHFADTMPVLFGDIREELKNV